MMHKKLLCTVAAAALISMASVSHAQNAPEEQDDLTAPPLLVAQGLGPEEGAGAPPPFGEGVELLGFEGMHGGKIIKGAPFSATATSDTTQTLQDGNTIHRTNKSVLYRDSEGRVRREVTLAGFGPLQAAGKTHSMIMINDPVAGAHYMLNPEEKVAHKMMAHDPKQGAREFKEKGLHKFANRQDSADFTTESLGTQNMNGVNAEGTRITHTIPAGQIGNDQPIKVVFERWYSPELQMVVKSSRSDPRFGTTTYNVTNIQRTEPAASLFSVPSDYTVKEGGPGGPGRRMRRFHGAPPADAPGDAPLPPAPGL
jgi:hypothetical protein